jgi:siroheme synthase-like protein
VSAIGAMFPLFLNLEGRRVLLVGGGPVATEKSIALREAGAVIRVVAPEVREELVGRADELRRREFVIDDLDGVWLVVSAAPPAVNRAVRAAAEARCLFVVAVDDVASCTAIGAARLRREGLTIAISSDGQAPALVGLLRAALDALLPTEWGAWMETAHKARAAWKEQGVPFDQRRPMLLQALNALYAQPGELR